MALPSRVLSMSMTGVLTLFGFIASEAGAKTAAPAGFVTGLIGSPSVIEKTAGGGRVLSLGDALSNEIEIRTQQDDSVEILWGQRTLIQVQPGTSVTIREKRDGQIQLQLPAGGLRVALAYGGPTTDIVTVQTPTGRVFTRGGIVEVNVVTASPSLLARVSTALSGADTLPPAARIETVKVLEGQSGIEPLASPGKSEMLEAGLAARISGGVIRDVSNMPPSTDRGLGLAATDRRQSTPAQLAQRIARVHVDHALEVERLMGGRTPDTQEVAAAGADLKGAVVATSLGVPTVGFTASAPAGSAAPGPTATQPMPSFSPPLVAPSPGGGNQSGGFNSKSILNEVLRDALSDRGRGRNNRGRDD